MRSKTFFTPISFFHVFFLVERELGMTFPLLASGVFVCFFFFYIILRGTSSTNQSRLP